MKCLLCLLLCPLLCLAAAWDGREIPAGLPAEEVERAQAATEAQIELGRRLFFDPVLSSDRTVACASCHKPDHGFADTEPFSTGVADRSPMPPPHDWGAGAGSTLAAQYLNSGILPTGSKSGLVRMLAAASA